MAFKDRQVLQTSETIAATTATQQDSGLELQSSYEINQTSQVEIRDNKRVMCDNTIIDLQVDATMPEAVRSKTHPCI